MNIKIKDIVIDGDEIFDFISFLIEENPDDVEFRNCDFHNDDIEKLVNFKKYERVAFVDCTLDNAYLLDCLLTKSVSFTNTRLDNYDFISNMTFLSNLTIVNGVIDIAKVNNIEGIEYLRISHSKVLNIEKISLSKLRYLFVDNTNINDLSFIKNLPLLELISISENQEVLNRHLLKTLSNKIKIIRDSIIEMEVM